MNATIARFIAVPAIAAGILGGALGLAAAANAQTTTTQTNGSTAIVSTPDHYANPAPNTTPGWHHHRAAHHQ
jgi:hypothetical protein